MPLDNTTREEFGVLEPDGHVTDGFQSRAEAADYRITQLFDGLDEMTFIVMRRIKNSGLAWTIDSFELVSATH